MYMYAIPYPLDAGKSTIGGHILFLTGQVDKRTLERYEREAKEKNRESWYLSWALDTNAEERDKVCWRIPTPSPPQSPPFPASSSHPPPCYTGHHCGGWQGCI